MATAKQIEYRLKQAKKKAAKLNKEVTAAKTEIKKLEKEFKKARIILIAKAAEKRSVQKKTSAVKKTGEKAKK